MRELQVVDAAELARAYAAADYAVKLDGDSLRLRVGEHATDIEAYCPADRYVFLTAWNPASQPASDLSNQAADAALVAQLDAAGAQRLAAWAQDPDGDWNEPGWLVPGLELSTADLLAREFGQAAVLAWERGEAVRLRMLLERPETPDVAPGASTSTCTDWVE